MLSPGGEGQPQASVVSGQSQQKDQETEEEIR